MEKLKQSESPEAVFTNPFARCGVKDIDKHVLFGVASKKSRKDFDEVFLLTWIGLQKAFSDVESVRPFAAVEPHPVAGTVGTESIQPRFVFQYPGLDLLKVDRLSGRKSREQQCERKEYYDRFPF
ncbi:MAG TPA: hypothetical protein VJ733_14235 [Candidatus Binatia bacterium]|nr:hypothetical protein [Candidatus Binatia bacterium]